ncbi:phage tail protein [Providencia rettgeri]|uniref:phage tail protein n=1 Tax=Providencia rettgeri TaxID=587 RepID=UPI001EE6BB7B|nr:phage tail protein [Providencia rettgeri]MCG5279863.1 phage tail protein [Providencia rettgeri]
MDEFKWRTQVQDSPVGEFRHRVREVVFGDGYKQVAGDGINPESQSWPITYTGLKVDVIVVVEGVTIRATSISMNGESLLMILR